MSGRIIGIDRDPTLVRASGVWTPKDVASGKANDTWPRILDYPTEVLADKPTAFYRFNETSGSSFADSSANSSSPISFGSVTIGQAGAYSGSYSAYFNGAVSCVSPSGNSFNPTHITGIEFIFKGVFPGAGGFSEISSRYASNTYNNHQVRLADTGLIQVYMLTTNSNYIGNSASGHSDNTWYHVFWKHDKSSSYLYVNGILKSSASDASWSLHKGFLANNSAYGWYFSRAVWTPTYYFTGYLQDWALYMDNIDEDRIQAHAKAAGLFDG